MSIKEWIKRQWWLNRKAKAVHCDALLDSRVVCKMAAMWKAKEEKRNDRTAD